MIDLSPAEELFIANASLMERLLFSIVKSDSRGLDEIVDMITGTDEDDVECDNFGDEKVRAVTRMLLMPSKSEATILKILATGLTDALFKGLVISYEDRLASDVRLLHSAFSFIPPIRAPPIVDDLNALMYAVQAINFLKT